MENYTIEIKLNDQDDDYNYLKLLFKQNNKVITSFSTNVKYFCEIFVNNFDPKKEKDCFNLFDCNGCVIITKDNNYLTFDTSIYGGECYGEMDFTVLITDEILLMIEKVKTIKQNLK